MPRLCSEIASPAVSVRRRRASWLAASHGQVAGPVQRACPSPQSFHGSVSGLARERERLLEPVQALNQMTAHGPESPERAPQAQRVRRLAAIDGPAQGRSQVFVLAFQPRRPLALMRPAQLCLRALG